MSERPSNEQPARDPEPGGESGAGPPAGGSGSAERPGEGTAPDLALPADRPDTLARALPLFYRYWSPILLTVFTAGCLAARAALGPPALADLAVAAAVVALWPVQEWLIHVFVLHFRPRAVLGRRVDLEVARLHRLHHLDPWQPDLILIPGRVYLATPLVVGAVLALAWPELELALTGVAVYFVLGLHYEWIHFLIHSRYRPRSAYYRRQWRNHRLHHFKNERYWYGVTTRGGDRLLRTAPDPADVPASPTCRTLAAASPDPIAR